MNKKNKKPDNKVLNLKGNIINLAVKFFWKNAISEILDIIEKNINLLIFKLIIILNIITNKNTISDIINISNEEAFDRNNR